MTKRERHYTLLFRSQRPDRGWQQCLNDARRHINFVDDLSARVRGDKARSKNAKKGWKTRRANQI